MSKVIAVAHRKGGVGKTTTVVHLATGMAAMALPVVAMDLDPQGNLCEFLGLSPAPDMYDLLMARRPARLMAEVLTSMPKYPTLRLVCSDDETKAAERALSAPETRRNLGMALQNAIDAIQQSLVNGKTPYILLDTPPGLGSLQLAALGVADYLLIPVNLNFASETGLPKLAESIKAIQERSGRGARLLGILPTRYKFQTIEHRTVLDHLKGVFGDSLIYPTVRDTIRLEECPGRGLPIWNLAPKSGGAEDYARVLFRLLKDLGISVNNKGGRR